MEITFTTEELLHELQQMEESESYKFERLKKEIANQIFEAMEHAGLSQTELADLVRTSRSQIARILQGGTNYTIETLCKIACAINSELCVTVKIKEAKKVWNYNPKRRQIAQCPQSKEPIQWIGIDSLDHTFYEQSESGKIAA